MNSLYNVIAQPLGFRAVARVLKAFLLCLTTVPGQAADCDRAASVEAVADGIFVRAGRHAPVFEAAAVANIGFVIGEHCVAVIDTGGSPAEGEALRCAIRERTDLPVCHVIATHGHPDHLLGHSAFTGGDARFVGHARLPRALALTGDFYRQRLAESVPGPLPESLLVAPDRTVAPGEPLELDLGGRQLRIEAHRSAHTDSDLSVYDTATATLWTGDLVFLEHVPVVDASSRGWLTVLETLSAMPAARAVPGHGPVSADWPQAAADTRRYLQTLRTDTRRWLDHGGYLDEAQEQVGYAEQARWMLFEEYHKRNVTKVYTEMEWE